MHLVQDLKLKEQRIQEELDENGNFPFDLTDGRCPGKVLGASKWC